MKRLLIVDDEQVERDGIKAILQKNFPELMIEQAKNGRIAIRMAESFKPELVLMDHKMPGLSGLETIQVINEIDPSIKFIMVTAYAEFNYARSAIKLGVKDYLLKPTKASELVQTVDKVKKSIEKENLTRKEIKFQQDALQKALPIIEADVVTQLLFDHVHDIHFDDFVELLDIKIMDEKFVMSIIIPHGSENIYSIIKHKLHQTSSAWVGALYGRQVPIIVFRKPDISFRTQAMTISRDILSLFNKEGNADWFIGIGNVYHSLDKIRQSYKESLIATKDTSLPVKYRFYSDIPAVESETKGYNSKQLEKQLFDQIRNGQKQEFVSNVSDLIQFYENKGADVVQTQQHVLELLWIASRALHDIGIEPETPIFSYQVSDYRQLRMETNLLLDQMWQSYLDHYNSIQDDTIQTIKQYIAKNAHNEISLEKIARKVDLSPIYISKLFKEKLGINYIQFLTQARIDMAKQLMLDPEKSLKEITFEVGYHDPNYFSKVFKKICNESPTDYRKTLL